MVLNAEVHKQGQCIFIPPSLSPSSPPPSPPYAAATAKDKGRMQPIIRSAEKVTGCNLPSLQDLYTSKTLKRPGKIVSDPSHPRHKLLQHSLLAGDCGPSGPKPHATRTVSSHLPLASSTRPGIPTDTDCTLPSPSTCYINVEFTHLTQCVTLTYIFGLYLALCFIL